jgi:hypothetical protein
MFNRMFKTILILAIFFTNNVFAGVKSLDNVLQRTPATIEVTKENMNSLNFNNTVLGFLLKESGKSLKELVEKDGKTIQFFRVKYNTDINGASKQITQYGFFLDLDPRLQRAISSHQQVFVLYKQSPLVIRFLFNDQEIAAPALVTKLR